MRFFIGQDLAIHVARKNGISSGTFFSRIRRGWALDAAASKPRVEANERKTKYRLGGEPALRVARANGLTPSLFYQRLRAGWSVEEAATAPPGTRKYPPPVPRPVNAKPRRSYLLDGELALAVARWNGIPDMAFFQRLYRGWTIRDAATAPLRGGGRRRR